MKYVLAHSALFAIALVCASLATWLVVDNSTADVNYFLAMLGMLVIGLAWMPVLIAGLQLSEELRYQKWRKRIRRKMSRRHHPSVH